MWYSEIISNVHHEKAAARNVSQCSKLDVQFAKIATGSYALTALCNSCGCSSAVFVWPEFERKAFPPDVIRWYFICILFSVTNRLKRSQQTALVGHFF